MITSMKKHKKAILISALGLFVLIVLGLGAKMYLSTPSPMPEDVRVTNQSDDSLTISWTTKTPVLGCVVYSPRKNPIISRVQMLFNRVLPVEVGEKKFCDDHNQKRVNHHVTLEKLEPESVYQYRILSGVKSFAKQLHTLDTEIYTKTKQSTEALPQAKTMNKKSRLSSSPTPLYGKVKYTDGLPARYINVYVSLPSSKTQLSTLTDTTGAYNFDLTKFYNRDGSTPTISLSTPISISVKTKQTSTSLRRATPAPDIVVSH